MGIEIERKFLVAGDAWRTQIARSQRMAQGYLNDPGALREGREQASMRIRVAAGDAWLNLKSRVIGPSRQEFEYVIPLADAEALLALCVGGRIEKTRHYIPCGGLTFEIDEFSGDNAGLVVAEIELPSEDFAFERPDWLGAEVTHETRYYNSSLAEYPFSRWTTQEQA
jgi:adenylate cyclase